MRTGAKLHRGIHKINGKKVKVEKAEPPSSNLHKKKALENGTCHVTPPSSANSSLVAKPVRPQSVSSLQTRSAASKPFQCTRDYQSKDIPLATQRSNQHSTAFSKAMQKRLQSANGLTIDIYTKRQLSSTEDEVTLSTVVHVEGVDGLTELHLEVAFDDGEQGGEIEEIVWKDDVALVTFKNAKGVCMHIGIFV